MTEGGITEFENRSMEHIQSYEETENSLKKKWIEPRRPMWQHKKNTLYVVKVSERKEKDITIEKIYICKVIMDKISQI